MVWLMGKSRNPALLCTVLPVVLLFCPALFSCGNNSSDTTVIKETCTGYPEWDKSEYVLPFSVGETYTVHQGNCSGFGHSGFWKYSYDFTMSIGTLVTAARGGEVLFTYGEGRDGDVSLTNLVTVQHSDGTVAVYSHLTIHGPLVEAGEFVNAGDPVGHSGNTGETGGFPHLHFSLHPCGKLPELPGGDSSSCPSIPLTFRNTSPNPQGLVQGIAYTALPF